MTKTLQCLKLSGYFGIAVFDNTQIFTSRKYHQKYGESSYVTLATSRIFIKATIPVDIELIIFPNDLIRVKITYLDQVIPSPHGMLPFETYAILDPSVYFRNDSVEGEDVSTDLTGKRVECYCDFVRMAYGVHRLRKLVPRFKDVGFNFQQSENVRAFEAMELSSCLYQNNLHHDGESSYYYRMYQFQRNTTMIWRGKSSAAELLIPPFSPEDETTNKGAAKVILSLLLFFGILEPTEASDEEGLQQNVQKMRLASDAKDRHLVFVGDGLSQIRAQTFLERN